MRDGLDYKAELEYATERGLIEEPVKYPGTPLDVKAKTRGKLIIFEGTDGSGKGTQLKNMKALLEILGHNVIDIKHPGGSPLGMEIRKLMFETVGTKNIDPVALDFLFMVNHLNDVNRVIRPALEAGVTVLADRFWTTVNPVYSQIRMEHRFPEWVYQKYEGVDYDALILMDGDPEIFLNRAQARTTETHQAAKLWNKLESMKTIRTMYHQRFAGKERTWIVKADRDPQVNIFMEQIRPITENIFGVWTSPETGHAALARASGLFTSTAKGIN